MGLFSLFGKKSRSTKYIIGKTEQAVKVFEANSMASGKEIMELLEKKLKDAPLALDLYRFLPIAYCRMMVGGVDFPETYMTLEADGSHKEHKFMENAIYVEVDRYTIRRFISHVGKEDMMSILNHSSEFDAINQALHKGSKLEDLVLAPLVFN